MVGKVTRYDVKKWYQVIIEVNFIFFFVIFVENDTTGTQREKEKAKNEKC